MVEAKAKVSELKSSTHPDFKRNLIFHEIYFCSLLSSPKGNLTK